MREKCMEKEEHTCKSYPNCNGCNAYRKPTNYDRLMNMSIEELAELLNGTPCNCCKLESNQNCSIPCLIGIKQWLESEVQGE